MANCILSVEPTAEPNTPQYQLPEAARQAILAGSESAKTARLIEDQYTKFAEKNNGCPFGIESESETCI